MVNALDRYLEERRKKFKARKGKLGEEREDKGEEEEGNGMKTSRKPPMDFSDLKGWQLHYLSIW